MFTPHTPHEIDAMLKAIGVNSIEELFIQVPAKHRFPELNLPEPLTEMEIASEDFISFLGAGAYNHYIPAAVDMILRRGEFYTAYTPYQPEISQGTLQAIFEFQSLMTELTGMDGAMPLIMTVRLPQLKLQTWLIIIFVVKEKRSLFHAL